MADNPPLVSQPLVDINRTLSEFLAAHRNGIKQHTDKWLVAKKYCIGGSQMATILGLNPYENIKSLVAGKANIGTPRSFGNATTQWGNIFESVLRGHVEKIFCTRVIGHDEFVRYSDDIAYSPDGLGAVPSRSDPTKGYLVLFEFKCPMSRIPSLEPPKYYVPQLLTGLGVLKMCAFSLYIEGAIRRCGWDQLGESMEYDSTFVPGRCGKNVLNYGFIGFRTAPMNWMNQHRWTLERLENAMKSEDFAPNDTNDFGICTPGLLKMLIIAVADEAVEVWYSRTVITAAGAKPPITRPFTEAATTVAADVGVELPPSIDTTSDDLVKFTEESADMYTFGILPYKMMKLGVHAVPPEPGFIDRVAGPVHDVVETIRSLTAHPPADRQKKFNEVFSTTRDEFEVDAAALDALAAPNAESVHQGKA